jgi:hypothetical protein
LARIVGRPAGDWRPAPDDPSVAPGSPSPGSGAAPGEAPRRPGRAISLDAVERGLRWLASHQSPDGRFEAEGFASWCGGEPWRGERVGGAGPAGRDVETTALSLAAFLGAGYSHRSEGPFGRAVAAAAGWLLGRQDGKGSFGTPRDPLALRDHAIATWALATLLRDTGASAWRDPVRRAVRFALAARAPGGGWGATAGAPEAEATVTAWMALALAAARDASGANRDGAETAVAIDDAVFAEASAALVRGQSAGPGRAQDGPASAAASTRMAAALVVRRLAGEAWNGGLAPDARFLGEAVVAEAFAAPIDAEGIWFGYVAAYDLGGDVFSAWDKALLRGAIRAQIDEGEPCAAKGSWAPEGIQTAGAGRVASTALTILVSEIWYRYDRVPRLDRRK